MRTEADGLMMSLMMMMMMMMRNEDDEDHVGYFLAVTGGCATRTPQPWHLAPIQETRTPRQTNHD